MSDLGYFLAISYLVGFFVLEKLFFLPKCLGFFHTSRRDDESQVHCWCRSFTFHFSRVATSRTDGVFKGTTVYILRRFCGNKSVHCLYFKGILICVDLLLSSKL